MGTNPIIIGIMQIVRIIMGIMGPTDTTGIILTLMGAIMDIIGDIIDKVEKIWILFTEIIDF